MNTYSNGNSTTWTLIGSVIFLIVVVGGIVVLGSNNTRGQELIPFAQCLVDKEAKFYGAFWCPHCRDQKAMFGKAASSLPYTECSTPDGQNQLQVCTDAGVKRYPTWSFKNSSSTELVEGAQTLEQLAVKTGCVLPVATENTTEEVVDTTTSVAQ